MLGGISEIVMLQSADGERYLPMLQATARVNREYCARHNLTYSQFIGIKRGFHPWQATFNRIMIMREMIDAKFSGWVFYLDADAYVWDLSFDVRRLIADIAKPVIAAPGGLTGEPWDVNSGVLLVDLDNETARDLILAWHGDFMRISERALQASTDWWEGGIDSDQPLLHGVLERTQRLQGCLGHADRDILNDSAASFVRQVLKCHPGGWEARLAHIRKETAAVLERFGRRDLVGS